MYCTDEHSNRLFTIDQNSPQWHFCHNEHTICHNEQTICHNEQTICHNEQTIYYWSINSDNDALNAKVKRASSLFGS